MYGQKEIISCMVIVTMVAILNYYKSIIKRDKQMQNARRPFWKNRKWKRNYSKRNRLLLIVKCFYGKCWSTVTSCYDMHALIYRPSEYDYEKWTQSVENSTEPDNVIDECNSPTENNEFSLSKEKESDKKTNEKADNSSKIEYVLVAILLGSLIKAALDVTKHYKKKDINETENDILRRCSLQEYSLLKRKQRNQPKAVEIFTKKSISTQRSLDSSSKATLQQQEHFMRRLSGNPQDYSNGSGFTTPGGVASPATPVAGNMLAGRPAPLLIRCSVPTFAPITNQNIIGQLRRPSMDSFSEDELGAETKRRVRMIHRH